MSNPVKGKKGGKGEKKKRDLEIQREEMEEREMGGLKVGGHPDHKSLIKSVRWEKH